MNLRKCINKGLTVIIIGLSVFISSCTTSADPSPTPVTPTTGLIVSVVTSTAGGNYSPRNIVAIWVEDSSGKFVKSLTVYADQRKNDLTNWDASSGLNTTDAVTGATRTNYGTINASWNGTNTAGAVVADGSYTLCMELTDKGTTGNYAEFTFSKGSTVVAQTPANKPSFSSVSIKWMPL